MLALIGRVLGIGPKKEERGFLWGAKFSLFVDQGREETNLVSQLARELRCLGAEVEVLEDFSTVGRRLKVVLRRKNFHLDCYVVGWKFLDERSECLAKDEKIRAFAGRNSKEEAEAIDRLVGRILDGVWQSREVFVLSVSGPLPAA